MDTRVIRPRGMWEGVGVQWRRQRWWVAALVIVWTMVIILGHNQFNKEFPPYATISKGPVEARIMTDEEDPARLKQMVTLLTASKVGAWGRYPAEKPIVRCTITPIKKAGYEMSCEFFRGEFTLVKQRLLADDQEVRQYLSDLHWVVTGSGA